MDDHVAEREHQEQEHQRTMNLLRPQSPPLVTHLLKQGHTSESLPNSSINWKPCIQIDAPWGQFSFRTPHHPWLFILQQFQKPKGLWLLIDYHKVVAA